VTTNQIEFLGMLAGLLSTVAFIPQVLKVWRTESTKGISRTMYILYIFGLVLWIFYAYLIQSIPLLITEIVTVIMAAYILFMKLKNQRS